MNACMKLDIDFVTFREFEMKTCIESPRCIRNLKSGTIAAIVIAVMNCGAVARAQQPKRVAAIGYLAISTVSAHAPRVEALRQGLRRPGYVEGQNTINESGDQPAVRMVELK